MAIPGREERTSCWSRRAVIAGLTIAPELVVTACHATHAGLKTSLAAITITPADRTRNADFTRPVTVTVARGTLSSVTVTSQDGTPVTGRLSADRTRWTTAQPLSSGTHYHVAADAVDDHRVPARRDAAFTTSMPAETFLGRYVPDDGTTVGVGMPISITFTRPITHKAQVERAIRISARPQVEVAGRWFGDRRIDFRPQEYWTPGTEVTVRLRLKDVEGARGIFGTQTRDVRFTIGRSQTTLVDLAAKQMTVTRDGTVVQTAPVSGGSPEHATWEGKMVITERSLQTRMDSQTVNLGGEYDITDVPHAQRLTTSGTFIHGNYWSSPSVFGAANVSHGCVGLRDVHGGDDTTTPAAQFYADSMVGDVVEVINSSGGAAVPDNGFGCWNIPWDQWRTGSASS